MEYKFPAPHLLDKCTRIGEAESDHGSDLKILIILANYIVFSRCLLYIVFSSISLLYLHFVTHSVSLNGLTAIESAL